MVRAEAEVDERGVGGDPGAEQRGAGRELEVLGQAQDEVLAHKDGAGVAAIRGLLVVAVVAVDTVLVVVGEDRAFLAELLLAVTAVLARLARVDHAANAHTLALLELGDFAAHLAHEAGDLVAGHHGEDALAPLAFDLGHIRVADAGVLDVDAHVLGAQLAALDRAGLELAVLLGHANREDRLACLVGRHDAWLLSVFPACLPLVCLSCLPLVCLCCLLCLLCLP
mmetsp:Transcript_15100/g.38112  ORF Transcript_15100/g.38112 Transcript_15100/m.38112 type:complete len:225 (-) Transcript_15100:60-734(-)